MADSLAGKQNILALRMLDRSDISDGFGIWDWSHWIRVEIACKSAVVSRPELPRQPRSCKKCENQRFEMKFNIV